MEEDIEVIAFACRGTLLDWTGAIEAVAYELARRNGESPLDRGVALRRRVETLADGHGLARGFERLARERGYASEESGEESLARVVALARPLRGARELVALAVRSGRAVGRRLPRREPRRAVRVRRAVRGRASPTSTRMRWASRPSACCTSAPRRGGATRRARWVMRAVAPAQLAGGAASARPTILAA